MREVRASAPGKVNLTLRVGPPNPDGYHPLVTVFEALSLRETVTVRTSKTPRVRVETIAYLPDGRVDEATTAAMADLDPGSHLAVRAARILQRLAAAGPWASTAAGVSIRVDKRVPVAGGMAGGSADAAAALVACNQLWGTGLNLAELTGLAARLGADVPFPLLGATAVGHGRGDDLSPLMTRGTYQWVFALAHEGLSTPVVFARFDELAAAAGRAPVTREVPDALTTALRTGDPGALAPALHNDLQAAAVDLRPAIAEVIALAERAGALRAIVSGSGPTVAALVPEAATAMRVCRTLTASGLVSGTVRADAPVAGARAVG